MVMKIDDSDCPLEQPSNSDDRQPQEFIGNNKKITIEHNRKHLRIIGNGNRVFVNVNASKLEIIGNSNRVKIANTPNGHIEYTGNGGKIYVCSDSIVMGDSNKHNSMNNIKYVGMNGMVKLVSKDELFKKSSTSSTSSVPPASTSPPPNIKSSYKKVPLTHRESRCQDDLMNKFNQKFQLFADDGGFFVNNMNVSLQNLNELKNLHSNNCGIRLAAAQSNLVINNVL